MQDFRQELLRALRARLAEEIVLGGILDDLAPVHEDDPVGALAELWERWKPQLDAYVTRALDPTKAPSYGVPGNK